MACASHISPIVYDNILSCVLDEDGVITKLRFVGMDEDGGDELDPIARQDADFVLLTGTLRRLHGRSWETAGRRSSSQAVLLREKIDLIAIRVSAHELDPLWIRYRYGNSEKTCVRPYLITKFCMFAFRCPKHVAAPALYTAAATATLCCRHVRDQHVAVASSCKLRKYSVNPRASTG